ncbi:hypothetical protein ACFVHB_30500 [Kitasatospora sp. NPDC127111]|uniref:hypothetical protein n=1 Tax=Kitasatospora sp. NPDC127111 TaxID=3345363 RepID=UPI0036281EE3
MQLTSPFRTGRRHLWLPALALAGAALAGCSSGGGGGSSAASSPAGTAATAGAGASTPAAPPASSAPASAPAPSGAAPTGAPTGAPAKRPADACTLLTSPQVIAAVGTTGPFTGTHPDPASDGSPVWGCTWGSRQSYASIHEVKPTVLATVKADPQADVAPVPGVGQEAVLAKRKDGSQPIVYFLADGHVYSVEVRKDRGPNDGVNAPAEALAEGALALVLAKSLTS